MFEAQWTKKRRKINLQISLIKPKFYELLKISQPYPSDAEGHVWSQQQPGQET